MVITLDKTMNLLQLTMTEREAILLVSMTMLGMRVIADTDTKEEIQRTIMLLNMSISTWPQEADSLASKLQILNNSVKEIIQEKVLRDERTMEGS